MQLEASEQSVRARTHRRLGSNPANVLTGVEKTLTTNTDTTIFTPRQREPLNQIVNPKHARVQSLILTHGLFPKRPNSIRQQVRQMDLVKVKDFIIDHTLASDRKQMTSKDPVELIE